MLNETLLLGAGLGLFQGFRYARTPSLTISATSTLSWPTHFEGARLNRIPSTGFEEDFATHFPEQIATFQSAGRQIILRQVNKATRKLSTTENQLRAAGYDIIRKSIDSEKWLSYFATNDQHHLHVRENISSHDQENWATASAWYWHALLNPKSGPWQATTVITPLLKNK